MPDPGPPPPPSDHRVSTSRHAIAMPHVQGYRFLKLLGRGGMASVYLATQESLDRPVGIKVMDLEALRDEVSKQRFENEARTIARLTHPGIVGIHEIGRTAEGQSYFVMPYLPNGDLSQHDLRGDEARIAELLRTLLSALEHAHSRGIVHRDVKRENVLFDAGDRPFLTDFGIALSKGDASRLTSAGTAVGSSGYMAPEQARGGEVDGRADLYSVGVLAFELLTGRLPFAAGDGLALALMHAQDPIPRLPRDKSHWQAFIDGAMAKQPGQRYANAAQMRVALDELVAGKRMVIAEGNHGPRLVVLAAVLGMLLVLLFLMRGGSDRTPGATLAVQPPAAQTPVIAPAEPAAEKPATPPPAPPPETKPEPEAPTATKPASPPRQSAPPKRPTLGERAKKAKGKVQRWWRSR